MIEERLQVRLLAAHIWKLQYRDFDAVWYSAIRCSQDEVQVLHPERGWVSGDPAYFEMRRGSECAGA